MGAPSVTDHFSLSNQRASATSRARFFFCPFQSAKGFAQLKREHPDLFERAVWLEKNGAGYEQGFYLRDRPLEELVEPLLAQGVLSFDESTDDDDEDEERCIVCGR